MLVRKTGKNLMDCGGAVVLEECVVQGENCI